MRDIELFESDLRHAKPLRPTSIGLAIALAGGLALLAVGVLLGAFVGAL